MSKSSRFVLFCAVVVAILAFLFFTFGTKVITGKASGESTNLYISGALVVAGDCFGDNTSNDEYTGTTDTEMDTFNTSRVVCYVPTGKVDSIAYDHQDMQANNEEPTVIVIDNGGEYIPDDTEETTESDDKSTDESEDKSNNGNHYGNDKPDSNDKDNSKFNGDDSREDFERTKDETKHKSSIALALFVSIILSKTGDILRIDGCRSAKQDKTAVVIHKSIGDELYIYRVPHARIDNVFLSESPFHHTEDSVWNKYLRDRED